MPLFDRDAEKTRKDNLRKLEDLRMNFAMKLEAQGFKPEQMFFCSAEDGSFVALARFNNRCTAIIGPAFGSDGDFRIDVQDRIPFEREDVFEKGSGLNGAFGFGKKGAKGFNLILTLSDGSTVLLPVVAGRTSWLETTLKKNPLLRTKRRRGDANVVWDFMPIDPSQLEKIEKTLMTAYLG